MRTQSARHRKVAPATAPSTTWRRPVKKAAPMSARAMTTKRLTAHPCAASKAAKLETDVEKNAG